MRKSGILMHITSLPGPYGIGTMGAAAYAFLDFLEAAGQSYWQILPVNPTGYGDSPYSAISAVAGNPYLIDLDQLVADGLLLPEEIGEFDWGSDSARVDFGIQYVNRSQVLRRAYHRFRPGRDYEWFVLRNQDWLPDYALFMAAKEHYHGSSWQNWPTGLMMHLPHALEYFHGELEEEVHFHYFLQFIFHQQWKRLRSYAREKGIRIIGDVPIYVPLDSADVWASPQLFQLGPNRRPKLVAGCPPDGFSDDGQLWGNPLYDWDQMKKTGYDWWIARLKAAARMYDVVRLDHFRGFESYWAVPAGDATARNGQWCPGPGMDFIQAIQQALPELDFIAEDLGCERNEVRVLQLSSGYPGMKVLEFAFDSRKEGEKSPGQFPVNSVCYTGTHDNEPLKQWLDGADWADVSGAKEYFGLNEGEGFVWGMIRGAMESKSRLCMVQMQDYLELGGEARMNFPGTVSTNNWTWRAEKGFDSPELAQKIARLTRSHGRCE